jgi:nucleoside permease NupC
MLQLQSALGIAAVVAFAFAFSENRRAVSCRNAVAGLAAVFLLALIFLKLPPVRAAFAYANHAVDAIAAATRAGTDFRVRLSRRRSPALRSDDFPAANSCWRSRRCRSCW